MKKNYIIDRIENDIAVCECDDGAMEDIKCSMINGRVREGAVITVLSDGRFEIDEEKTAFRKKEIENLMKGMWSDEE